MDNNNVANIPYTLSGYYDRTVLERATPRLNYLRFAQIKDIPTNNTDTIKFRQYVNLSAATTPLIEGVTPAGSKLSLSTFSAQVKQYGDYVPVTEWVDWTVEDPVLTEIAGLQGDQAGLTLDTLMGAVLVAGTNVLYASTAVSRVTVTAAMKLDETVAKNGSRILHNNNARPVMNMIEPNSNYGTKSVGASFPLFIHSDTTRDLKDAAGFTKVKDYANPALAIPGEVGFIDEFRCIESTNAKIFTGAGAAGINVYASIAVAENSYGATRIAGKAMQNIRKAVGSAGAADPLEQRGTSGWKSSFVGVRLQEAWILRLEHGTSYS